MNPEDVRKLIGGYATGSLSQAERRLLFEAALKDDELFEELAGEQVLKEILEEPGARQRLLSALGTEAKLVKAPWWSRSWPWMGGAVTVAVAIIIVVALRTPVPQPPQEIAEVLKSAEPVAAPASRPPSAPAAPAPQALRKVAPPTALEDAPKPSVDAIDEARSNKAQVQALAAAPPPPAPQQQRVAVGAVSEFAARGGRAEALRSQNETVTVTETIGPVEFNYSVGADGFLQIVPVNMGFVAVVAEFTDRDVVVFPNTEVAARMPLRIQIPANATGLIIGFSRTPGVNDSRIRPPLIPGLGFDLDPPNGRVRIHIPAKP